MTLLLQAETVSRHYRLPRTTLLGAPPRLTAVDRVSFALERGRTLGIVGESGSGKSTLARMVMAFEAPDAGRILFQGQDLNRQASAALRRLRRQFQMVFQDPYGSLDPRRTIGWSIAEPLRALGEPPGRRIDEVLQQVGLQTTDAAKYPHEFSGGQRQRIAIARALIIRPELILFDEAVSALDVSVRAQILDLLAELCRAYGLSYLFISHDLSVVRTVTDRVLVMQAGKIVEQGDTEQVFSNPSHPYTQSLIAAAPRLPDPEALRRSLSHA